MRHTKQSPTSLAPIKALADMLAQAAQPRRNDAEETALSYEIARRQWTQHITDLRQWDDDRAWSDAAQDGAKDAQEAKDNQQDFDVWPTQAST